DVSFARQYLQWPWLKWRSGVDLNPNGLLRYTEGYSFDQHSPWASRTIDVSRLISHEAFAQTFESLPARVKADADAGLAPLKRQGAPLICLLLFGLSPTTRLAYQASLSRIFKVREAEFRDRALVVKPHPGMIEQHEEGQFFRWVQEVAPCPVFILKHPLNLEF